MRYLILQWYNIKYMLKHNITAIIAGMLYATLIIIWNITSYTSGLYIKHTIKDSIYNTFTSNITLLVLSIIAVILYNSDLSDKTYTYIRMRPINPMIYTGLKVVSIWIITSVFTTGIYLSDSLLVGKFSLGGLITIVLTTLNIAIISSSIGALIGGKASIFVIAGYSGLSTSLHDMFTSGTIASWLKSISMIAPIYNVIPWVGILALILLLIKELRRNIRA